MEKKKLEYFRKRLEERQQVLRRNVSRTELDGVRLTTIPLGHSRPGCQLI